MVKNPLWGGILSPWSIAIELHVILVVMQFSGEVRWSNVKVMTVPYMVKKGGIIVASTASH